MKPECLACLKNETPCDNLMGLFKLDCFVEGLNITKRVLRCPKDGFHYELLLKGKGDDTIREKVKRRHNDN